MNTSSTISIIVAIFLIGFGYGKSKTWGDKLRFTLVPISITISIAFIYFMVGCWKFNNLGNLSKITSENLYPLQIVPILLITYCSIASVAITFCAWKKKGFTNLKKFGGLFSKGLIARLTTGLIVGLVGGIIAGLASGIIVGLITELISGIISGLILGLIGWLIIGLIVGFKEEFK